MGNSVGVPTAEISEVAQEMLKTFTPIYIKHFALSMIYQIKIERNAKPSQYYLQKPPTPSEPLQTGTLVKQGAVRKNWKDRFFAAMNQADNYEIKYYTDEAAFKTTPDKPRGSINLCWYRVERTHTDADKKEYGEFSLKAMPWWASDRRRTWYIRADSEESVKKWLATFEYAARKAGPPLNPDPIMRRAFMEAYRETRWRLDEWGWYYYSRSEMDQLAVLVVDRCERGCMRPVYAKIPSGRMEYVIRKQVVSLLDQTVGAAVGAGWKSVSATIASQKDEIKSKVEAQIGVIFDKQIEMKNKISSTLLDKIRPVVEKGANPVLTPVSKVFLRPLFEAYREAVTIFINHMRTTIGKCKAAASPELSEKIWDAGLRDFKAETTWYWGSLHPAFAKVRDLTQYNPSTSNQAFKLELPLDDLMRLLDGVELWQIERKFEEGIRKLSRRAVYTLKVRSEDKSASDKEALLAEIAAAMIHDAKVRSMHDMQWIFSSVILPPIRKTFLPTIKDVLEPIKSLIPDALKSFLDIDEMVEEILTDVVHGLIYGVIVPATNSTFEPLNALAFGGVAVDSAQDPMHVKAAITSPVAGAASEPRVLSP